MVGDNSKGTGNDFEVADVENYRGDKLLVFNHQILVMEILRKVNEAGCHELRPGWFNEKMDREGNTTRTYVEDTRLKFIESIKTSLMVMQCDFDEEAEEFIEQCHTDLESEKRKLLENQWGWFQALAPKPKQELSGSIIKGVFNQQFGWYTKFMELRLECYRAIATELNDLTKRLDFYQTADFEA